MCDLLFLIDRAIRRQVERVGERGGEKSRQRRATQIKAYGGKVTIHELGGGGAPFGFKLELYCSMISRANNGGLFMRKLGVPACVI